ncbi:MAG: T9SS type A sorting domain-containing protein [Saprospiraceae bacterium]|nr:T9SS type A sorting domain-containing protein [Saprospiraceae bacterium]
MTIIKKISIFHFVLTGLLLWFADASAQSIDHLVRIHSTKNTEMRPLDVERVDDHIYTVYEYIHRDTIKIDGVPLGLDTLPREQMPIVISQFDTSHQLLRTSVLTASRPFRGAIAYQNVRHHGDRIYLFVSIYDKELRYNGKTIWTATPTNDIFTQDRWYVMVTLDSDLNLVSVKGIDHWYSGFEDVAFGEDRMYLFGRVTHSADLDDTVFVEGYGITKLVKETYTTTTFMFIYELSTGNLINVSRVNIKERGAKVGSVYAKTGPDGNIYQIINTSGHRLVNDKLDSLYLSTPKNMSVLIKYNKNGDFEMWNNFLEHTEAYTKQLEITSKGEVWLFSYFARDLGSILASPNKYHTVLTRVSTSDLQVNWFDYISVKGYIFNALAASIYPGRMHKDIYENIYTISSFTSLGGDAKNKSGQNLIPGTYIQKYDFNGLVKHTTRWANSKENPGIASCLLNENQILFLKNVDGDVGDYDSIVNEVHKYFNQMYLFKYKIEQTTSTEGQVESDDKKLFVYPNPVKKDGILTVVSKQVKDNVPYTIFDINGRMVGHGILDSSDKILLERWHLQGGIYFLTTGFEDSVVKRIILTD